MTLNFSISSNDYINRFIGRSECILLAHDWGGAVGWKFVAKYPEMVTKFIPMNCPHSASFQHVIKTNWGQKKRSWYMFFFQLPILPEILLTAFSSALFFHWIHKGRAEIIGEENVRIYMDRYRQPSNS